MIVQGKLDAEFFLYAALDALACDGVCSGCYAAAALPSQPAYIVDTHGVPANIAQQHVVKKHAYKVENERLRKADGQVLGAQQEIPLNGAKRIAE